MTSGIALCRMEVNSKQLPCWAIRMIDNLFFKVHSLFLSFIEWIIDSNLLCLISYRTDLSWFGQDQFVLDEDLGAEMDLYFEENW